MNKKFINKTLMYQYDKELASAFQIDCENFLDAFEKMLSFDFCDFLKVWHNTKFTNIFARQVYALLLKDFCENCFFIVKKYIMFPRSMYTQIGAFYMLYALYYRQPIRGWIKIRLTLEEYSRINEIIMEMKNRHHFQPVYIFAKMRSDEVFLYVAQRTLLGPEERFIKGLNVYINDTFTATKTQSSLTKFLDLPKNTNILTNYENTNKEYSDLLKKLSGKYKMAPFSSNLVEDIKKQYEDFDQKNIQGTVKTDDVMVKNEDRIGKRRRAIKKKALCPGKSDKRKSKSDLSDDSSDSDWK